jgi:hypothetical protein
MSNENPTVEKLQGENNWASWKIIMQTILNCDGVFEVVSGEFNKPLKENASEFEKWNQLNNKAKKRLILLLDTKPLLRVGSCSTSKEVWEKLNQIYDTQSAENFDILRHKFHSIQWEWAGGIQAHLAKFDEIETKIMLLNKPFEHEDLCARFLQTLPKEFDHIYVNIYKITMILNFTNKVRF